MDAAPDNPKPQDGPEPGAGQETHLRFFTEIGIIDQLVGDRLRRALPRGVSFAQFGVLTHFVRRGGAQTPASLAAAFQVTRGAMTNTLQRLEAHGYVEVTPDARDGRVKRVSLTPAGAAAYRDIAASLAPLNADLTKAFPAARLAGIMDLLVELRLWLDANR